MKKIYLTFDDGPSETTDRLLNILKDHGVHASFFVTAKYGLDDMIGRMKREGHAVCLHSYSHEYADVYSTVEGYFDDLARLEKLVEEQCGSVLKVVRLPDGSDNAVCSSYGGEEVCRGIISSLLEKGYLVFDWDCDNRDGLERGLTTEEYYRNAVESLAGRDDVVYLSHTRLGDENSIEAVDRFIALLKEQGYSFRTMDEQLQSSFRFKL